MLSFLHKTLFSILKPITKFIGKVHLPYTHKKMSGMDYYSMFPLLKKGTIFLTRTEGEATTILIPGFWKHAAVYTPKSNALVDEVVTEAVGEGVIENDLVSFLMKKDFVLALEPLFLGDKKEQIMGRAAEIAGEQMGKPYDYDFEFRISNNEAFYCSELIWWAYDKACKEFGIECPFVPRKRLGEATITPDDIAKAASKFQIVWDSRKKAT